MEEEAPDGNGENFEQIVIDFGEICRFCLAETNSRILVYDRLIFDDSGGDCEATIFQFVNEMTSLKMESYDGFPSLVCENCFNIIKMCFEFRQSCQRSDSSLRDCYEKTLNEAKAKYSFQESKVGIVQNNKVLPKEEASLECAEAKVKCSPNHNEVNNDCRIMVEDNDIYKNVRIDNDNENLRLKLSSKKKQVLFKKHSLSVLKAGTIKQKYKRINSLTERLKDAQSKLVDDILRTNEIMSTSIKIEDSQSNETVRLTCPQCFMSFVTSETLTYHFISSHITEKKIQRTYLIYQCKVCKKEFSYMYQLMSHYKNMHKIPVSKLPVEYLAPKNSKLSSESTKSYQCLDCLPPKVFSGRKNLIRHLTDHVKVEDGLRHSTGNGPGKFYTCTRCDSNQTFATKFSLNRHLMNIHKMERSEINDENDCVKAKALDVPPDSAMPVAVDVQSGLKLLKIYVCVECSPLASFSDVSHFIEHKSVSHNRKLDDISLKELTPVYVESVNVFQCPDGGGPFKVICKSCDTPSEFFSASEFVQHMMVCHEDTPNEKWDVETHLMLDGYQSAKTRDRIWKCTECPASYIRKHSLHYHLKDKHNKTLRVGGVVCPEPNCGASFFTNRQVIQHGITVHEKYFANLHKVFKDKILSGASEADHRVRNFECDICQKKYLGKTSLKRHILKTHLGKSDVENVVCPYCGKTFANNLNLKSHIDFVHEALFVSCPICKKNINLKTIGKHYKIHQADTGYEPAIKNRYLCNQCGRILKSKSGFEDHQKLHLNVRDQICDVCGSGFTTKKNLYIHKKAHNLTQKKVFECNQCNKVFTGKHTLNRHLLTHSGEKNFICEICSKCFYTLQELNRHVRYHKKEYRFDCQLCDMRFLDRSRFRHHMMRHRNIRPHKCHFCDKVFIVRRKMNLHMAARHNVEVQNTKSVWKDPKTYIPLDDLL